jgi:hypothetical protein
MNCQTGNAVSFFIMYSLLDIPLGFRTYLNCLLISEKPFAPLIMEEEEEEEDE